MAVFSGNGSAVSPSFTFSSDTNTGIFRPAADQLAIATNGSTRLFINEVGRVGIGITGAGTTLANLSVKGTVSGTTIVVEGSSDSDFTQIISRNPGGVVLLLAAGGNAEGNVRTTTDHPLDIYANNSRVARFGNNGNVAISSASFTPHSKLTVATSADGDVGDIAIGLGTTNGSGDRTAKIIKNTTFPRELTLQAGSLTSTFRIVFKGAPLSEYGRFDDNGRLLVGGTAGLGRIAATPASKETGLFIGSSDTTPASTTTNIISAGAGEATFLVIGTRGTTGSALYLTNRGSGLVTLVSSIGTWGASLAWSGNNLQGTAPAAGDVLWSVIRLTA
jgi:hypothetical protein